MNTGYEDYNTAPYPEHEAFDRKGVKRYNPTVKDMVMALNNQCRNLQDSIDYDLGDELIISHLEDIEITIQKIKDKMIADVEGSLNESLNSELNN